MSQNPNISAFDSEAEVLIRLDKYDEHYLNDARKVFAHLGLPEDEAGTIVDLGCSTGRSTRALLDTFPKAGVIGIDGAPRLIEYCRQQFANEARVKFIVSAFEEIEWAGLPQNCAGVISTHSLEHVEPKERGKIFAGIYGILREGGVFITKDWSKDPRPNSKMRDRSDPGNTPEFYRRAIAEGRITDEEHWRLWDKLAQPEGHFYMSVEEQVAALQGAGFKEAKGEWLNDAISRLEARK